MVDIYIIRGGYFGWEYTLKLIYVILGLILCIYDWKKNNRKDYFWVLIFGTLLYIGSEVMLFLFGGRVMQGKYLFGINITSMHWLTIPLLVLADVVVIAIIAIFFADRLMNSETQKKWGIIFIIWVVGRDLIPYIVLYFLGYSYATVSVGDPLIPSRRNMTEMGTIIALSIMILIGLIWLIRTDKKSRKRGLYMIGVMLILMTVWTIGEWFAGQRWIEIGPEEGPWIYAPPPLQFGMLLYDIVIEMGLFTVCFLAIPSLLKLIKKRD
ncbi:MAG: hypothetical protein HWN80_03580 [Candidatus Lokiarchaeota archaeon]|nr:hypothetical protein [Candidatus Lokiarchaeota archaeon]